MPGFARTKRLKIRGGGGTFAEQKKNLKPTFFVVVSQHFIHCLLSFHSYDLKIYQSLSYIHVKIQLKLQYLKISLYMLFLSMLGIFDEINEEQKHKYSYNN